jgi:arylsulfatase A-like enzyme
MFIGLGDMDEFAHKNDYRDYVASMQAADKVIGSVMKIVDAMGDRGQKTSIFVTADHGRAEGFRSHGGESPESANVFLVAAGGDIPAHGLVSPTKKHHLADVAPTIRALLGLAPRTSETAGEPIAEIVAGP